LVNAAEPGRRLARNPEDAGQLVGSAVTYADLSLFQIVEGLLYAFPRRMQRTLTDVPRVPRRCWPIQTSV
jgi:glutathione S-transferase